MIFPVSTLGNLSNIFTENSLEGEFGEEEEFEEDEETEETEADNTKNDNPDGGL